MATTLSFPSALQHRIVYPLTLTMREGFTRTSFASGYTRQRRRFDHEPTIVNANFLVSHTELKTAQDFFTSAGADYFTFPVMLETGVTTDYDMRLVAPVSWEFISCDWWRGSITAETRAGRQDSACSTCNESISSTSPGTQVAAFPSAYQDNLLRVREAVNLNTQRDALDPMGAEQMRRDYVLEHLQVSMDFTFSHDEWDGFHTWLRASGFYWFTMDLPSPLAGASVTRSQYVRFIADPQYTYVTCDRYNLSIEAEVTPFL